MAIPTATQSLACDHRPPREPCSPAQRRLPVSFMLFSATIGGGCTVEKPDHRHRRLLRARREGPRRSSAAEERDEAAPYSITSSAGASSCAGSIPRALDVVRLMTGAPPLPFLSGDERVHDTPLTGPQ